MADRLHDRAVFGVREGIACPDPRSIVRGTRDLDRSGPSSSGVDGCAQTLTAVVDRCGREGRETVRQDRAAEIDGLATRADEHE